MSDLIGQSLGRYHILEQLGEGGMATVYKAYDTRLETEVAVKIIRTDALPQNAVERALKRFEREAKALAKLTHANIVKVTDYGEYEGSPYLVMEYLPGGTLKEKLAGKPMAWREALKILLPIARALDYAHRQNMIHRDVKPSNILITADGDPLLTDFGIAKILDEEGTQDLTGTSAAVGTPEYMAPEQATAKFVDKRADIYSLGIVLYEMLTGRRPFTADTPMAVLIKQATEPLPRPSQFVRDLPPKLEQVLLKALAKNPADRYPSMSELAAALEGAGEKLKPVPMPVSRPAARTETKTIAEPSPAPTLRDPTFSAKPSPRMGRGGRGAALSMSKGEGTLRKWLPLGALVILLGIALAIGNGLFGLGRQGMGPLAALATDTATPTSTSTPTHTPVPTKTLTPTLTFTPTPGIGDSQTRPADGMLMMYIPAGEFQMGSMDGDSDEQPVHTVYLDAFWMDQNEVTNRMYVMCMDAGECEDPGGGKRSSAKSYPNYPASGNWEMANAYCGWASGHLPTEAEWEKAARGGLEEKKYPWGDESPTCQKGAKNGAQFSSCPSDTVEVKSFSPNGFGLYDLAGNVWEWVADWYDSSYYANSPSSNPQGPASGQYRVLRGGAWISDNNGVRSALRSRYFPANAYSVFGFRCARSLP